LNGRKRGGKEARRSEKSLIENLDGEEREPEMPKRDVGGTTSM